MGQKFKPYDKYKDSGVEWLGKIPEHWNVRRLRTIASIKLSGVDKHTIEGEIPVKLCNYLDVYKNDYITHKLNFMKATATETEIKNFSLQIGDVLITKDSESWDDIAIPACVSENLEGVICAYHLAMIRTFKDIFNGEYLFRCFSSEPISYQFRVAANGVTRYGLSQVAIKEATLPMPSLDEQKKIAVLLRYKTKQIKKFIRNKQKLIKLLTEQKQAIINQAVTKGINPDVNLKPSGIDWQGEIPEHWEGRRLRYLVKNIINNTNNKSSDEIYIALENIESWTGRLIFPEEEKTFESQVKKFESNDVLFGKLRPYLAKVVLVSQNGVCSGEILVLRNQIQELETKFLEYKLRSYSIIDLINSSTYGAKMPRAEWNFIGNISFTFPSKNEQEQILAYIEAATKKIDYTIQKAQQEIELIKEYQTRLISDVVTGKIDVREIIIPSDDEEVEDIEDLEDVVEELDETEDTVELEYA